jgi:hypothetical protein
LPRGSWGKIRTSLLVRDYLLKVGKASIYETWKAVLKQLEGTKYLKPSYGNMRTFFYILRRLGLIRRVGVEKSSKRGYYDKTLYAIVRAKANHSSWLNPYEALYKLSVFRRRIHLTFE